MIRPIPAENSAAKDPRKLQLDSQLSPALAPALVHQALRPDGLSSACTLSARSPSRPAGQLPPSQIAKAQQDVGQQDDGRPAGGSAAAGRQRT